MDEVAQHENIADEKKVALVKRGKKQLIVIIIIVLSFDFIVTAGSSALAHTAGNTVEAMYELAQGAFRFFLECLLLYFVYRGRRWAKILMVVLLFIGVALAVLLAFVPGFSIYILALALPYIVFIVLMLGQPIKAFQQYQRESGVKGGV